LKKTKKATLPLVEKKNKEKTKLPLAEKKTKKKINSRSLKKKEIRLNFHSRNETISLQLNE
jgi:hypothetical protein